MTKIIGLDVCRSSVAVCLLEGVPDRPGDWFKKNRKTIPYLSANSEGLETLLSEYSADIAILEPTGIHYSTIWAKKLKSAGTLILWVGHAQLKYYRSTLRLPNKNDQADALALAAYGHQFLGQPEYFLSLDLDTPGAIIREMSLQLRHLRRVQNPIINRLRQNLAHEWPEIANSKSMETDDDAAPLWRYIAGHKEKLAKISITKYDKKLAASIGLGLSQFTKEHAARLIELQYQGIRIEKVMSALVSSPQFKIYNEVFDRFKFGRRVRAMILSHIYPMESFLLADHKEHIEYVENRNGNRSKRYRSLSSFKLALGYGLVEDSSGKSEGWIPGGSKLCRISLFQWVYTMIEPKGGVNKIGRVMPSRRPENHIGLKLGNQMDKSKEAGLPVFLIRARVSAKAAEMLFYELLAELRKS